MNEYKKLAYQMEDTFILGKSLPVVAMRQLSKIAEKLMSLEDTPEYLPRTSIAVASHIETFVRTNGRYMDDERGLKEIFEKACKSGMYNHHYLNVFSKIM